MRGDLAAVDPVLASIAILVALAFAVVNLIAFAAFGIDKRRAEAGDWRITEDTLLTLALIGGTAGAYAGRWIFRHKTRKQPFSNRLFNILVLQLAGIAAAATWFLTG